MAKLAAISQLNGSTRGQIALAMLLMHSPTIQMLDSLNAFEVDSTEYSWRPRNASNNAPARAIGAAYTPAPLRPNSLLSDDQKFHGGAVEIDIAHLADAQRGLRDFPTWLEKESKRLIKTFARSYDTVLHKSDGTASTLKGLAAILDGSTNIPGLGITGVVDAKSFVSASVSELDLTDEANYDKFYTGLKDVMGMVPGGVIVCNSSTGSKLDVIAHKLQILGEDRSLFGVSVSSFDRVAIKHVYNESMDDGDIYISRFGEGDVSFVTNSGLYYMDWDHVDNKESNKEIFEIRGSWKIEEDDAIRRITNIKIK